jgi:hypothetical protein
MAQVESIRRAMHAQPFRPFGIKLANGEVYTIKHPDDISIPPVQRPREVIFHTATSEGSDDYQTHWIDLGLVLEIIVPSESQATSAQPKAEGNGA